MESRKTKKQREVSSRPLKADTIPHWRVLSLFAFKKSYGLLPSGLAEPPEPIDLPG